MDEDLCYCLIAEFNDDLKQNFFFSTLFWKRHKCTKLKLIEQLWRDRGCEVFTVIHGRAFNTRPTYTRSVLSFEAAGHCALCHTTHWFKRKCSHNYCKQQKKNHHSCWISKILWRFWEMFPRAPTISGRDDWTVWPAGGTDNSVLYKSHSQVWAQHLIGILCAPHCDESLELGVQPLIHVGSVLECILLPALKTDLITGVIVIVLE